MGTDQTDFESRERCEEYRGSSHGKAKVWAGSGSRAFDLLWLLSRLVAVSGGSSFVPVIFA
jgi:hypothetical protein